MERTKYHIMSQTVDVNTEPLKWPIAPDGYIPNSVIRSWGRKGKGLTQTNCWDDIIFYSLHQECTTDDHEDLSTRIMLFNQDEEEEEERPDDVKRRMKEKEDEKNKKEEDKTVLKAKEVKKKEEEIEKNEREYKKRTEVERKEMADEKKMKEEDKMDRSGLMRQSHDIQTKTDLPNHLKTSDVRKMKPKRQEVGSTYKTMNFS